MTAPDAPDFGVVTGGKPARRDLASLAATGRPALLRGCDLSEADLSDLDLANWRFDRCTLHSTNLTQTILEGAQFSHCRGAFAQASGVRAADAHFASCDFNNAAFVGATLTAATFAECKLTGADFSKAHTTGWLLTDTIMADARLCGLSFRKAHLTRVDFSHADLSACDFRDAVFDGCSLREAHLVAARFEAADLRGADLGGLKLLDATRFKGAVVSHRQAADLLAQLGLRVL